VKTEAERVDKCVVLQGERGGLEHALQGRMAAFDPPLDGVGEFRRSMKQTGHDGRVTQSIEPAAVNVRYLNTLNYVFCNQSSTGSTL